MTSPKSGANSTEQVTQLDGFMGPAEFHALLLKDIAELLATKKKLGLS